MRRHPGLFVAATAVGAGLIALTLLPGTGEQRTEAEEGVAAVASSVAPNPELLRQLDFEVSAPPVQAVKVAAIQPARATPAAEDLAAPTAAALPAAPTNTSFVGAVAVNMRSGPSTSSGPIAVLQAGQAVQTGQTSGGWVQVTLADGSTGWVYGTYLAGGAPKSPTAAVSTTALPPADPAPTRVASAAKPRAVIHGDAGDLEDRTARIASSLSAFSRPLDSAPSIFTLHPGDRVRIAEVRGDWLKVQTPDGITGWIRRAD